MKRSKGMDSLYGRTDDATRVSGRTVSKTERERIVTKKDYSEEGSGLTERKSNGITLPEIICSPMDNQLMY